jgi:nitrogen regulatory protein PII
LAGIGNAPSPEPRTCIEFLPKIKLEIIVIDEIATAAAETVEGTARIG